MATKSKHARGTPFSTQVSDAIRHHVGEGVALASKRANAFEERDAVLAELAELDDHESREAVQLKARHSDATVLIDDLDKRLKWHAKQVQELVHKADEPGFDFVYDMPDEPVKKKARQLPLAAADTRPVGRPGKPRPEAPDPARSEGVDEHLAASVNELDMQEDLKGKLQNAGLMTVGSVAAILDDETQSLSHAANCTDKDAEKIGKAVGVYRKKHRKAAREVEGATA